ncbi:TRAP transporter small permease [Hoeflea poritis]|uniref:TRAP transporter small permease protein n=1 Tax=Hoeflea poritis TaxID=2993659 RepID=A0ABT4VKK9_9HYPH|nr:TRAP transporter small permease [Hoeflea poritis]MDA4844642.1 TRAP transporter small permease [Hoeflea poritis]
MSDETPSTLVWLDRQLGRVAGLLAIIGAVSIVGLMLITIAAVTWRYGLNDPIFGIEDLSVVTLTLVAGAAVAYGARHNAHVSVDVISYFFGRRVTRYTDTVMRILAAAIAGLSTYALFGAACGIEKACITNNFSIEHRPFYYFLGVTLGVYTLHLLLRLAIGLSHFSGEDPNEIGD